MRAPRFSKAFSQLARLFQSKNAFEGETTIQSTKHHRNTARALEFSRRKSACEKGWEKRERAEWLTLLGFIQLQKITILSHNVQSVLTRLHQIEQRHITQTIMLTIFIGTPLIASVPCNECTLVRRNCIQIFMLLLLIESGMCVWWQKFPQNKEVTCLWRDTSKKKCVNWQFCNSRGFLQKLFFQRDHP